ncbi:hypothetical protein [Sphingomonas colocasiae]|uniref:Uncharacterized protein n=1 Tax=Sphingomonas colocasiae TaxID=1848973 RepID=A0ABS7PP97_9SPHN|nr:hypothetical protein [Sphingomonas colocasiae]MBY8821849.1 hypothetical protein [Sphingomonas colocasiae]
MTIEHPDGSVRVLIVRRSDGVYAYRLQWRSVPMAIADPDSDDWGPAGPDCGLYDSADTAETEARQRVAWLKAGFH